jgi:hypothetical protein
MLYIQYVRVPTQPSNSAGSIRPSPTSNWPDSFYLCIFLPSNLSEWKNDQKFHYCLLKKMKYDVFSKPFSCEFCPMIESNTLLLAQDVIVPLFRAIWPCVALMPGLLFLLNQLLLGRNGCETSAFCFFGNMFGHVFY